MKVLLDVRDEKAAFFLEIIKNFKFVTKTQPLSDSKAQLMSEIREAVENLKLVRKGKLKGRPAKDLLNEI